QRQHPIVAAGVADVDLGAQLVEIETLCQVDSLVADGLEQKAAAGLHDEEVEQDLALRGQQRGVDGGLRRQQVHVVADDPLQQLLGVLACDAHDASVRKQRDLRRCHRRSGSLSQQASMVCYPSFAQVITAMNQVKLRHRLSSQNLRQRV